MELRLSYAVACLSALLAAPGIAPVAFAAEQDSGLENTPARSTSQVAVMQIEEVRVTARRRDESLMQVPVAVSSVSGDAMEREGIHQLQQLAIMVPNLMLGSNQLLDAIYMRGIGTSPNNAGFEQTVGLFIDGVYYGNGRWMRNAYVDVDQVQVMRGPQGALFGKNTAAGAIDITTRNPTDSFEGSVQTGYEVESKETYAQAVLSGPLTDTLAARLVVRAAQMEGWMRNGITRDKSPDSEELLGRLGLSWTPSDTFDVVVKGQYSSYEDDGPNQTTQLIACGGGEPGVLANFGLGSTDDCRANGTTYVFGDFMGQPYTDYDAGSLAVNANLDTRSGTFTFITGLNRFNFRSMDDNDFSSANAIQAMSNQRTTAVSQEVRFLTDTGGPLNFLVGAYYQSTDMRYANNGRVQPIPGWSWQRRSSQDGRSWAAFGEAIWTVSPTIEVSLGGRHTDERKKSKARNIAFGVPVYDAPSFRSTFDDDDFSPSATIRWSPNDDTMIYASYREGFKAGGFSHGATLNAASQLAGLEFGSEQVSGYEVGAKLALAARRARISLVAYDYDYEDLQVNSYNPVLTGFTTTNAAEASTRGVELEVDALLTPTFTLSGSLTYNRGRFEKFIGQCHVGQTSATGCDVPLDAARFGQDLAGRPTAFAPEWTARISTDYTREIMPGIELTAGLSAQYSDSYFTDVVQNPLAFQDDYVRLNANIGVRSVNKGWRFALVGQNLTNETVLVSANERPLAGADIVGRIDRLRVIELQAGFEF